MADVSSIYATHYPNWAGVQELLSLLLTADERWLVLSRADQETQHLYKEDCQGILDTVGALSRVDTNWTQILEVA